MSCSIKQEQDKNKTLKQGNKTKKKMHCLRVENTSARSNNAFKTNENAFTMQHQLNRNKRNQKKTPLTHQEIFGRGLWTQLHFKKKKRRREEKEKNRAKQEREIKNFLIFQRQ